jgi:hypothetical protein
MAYKVVQWATGPVGLWSLRQIIDRPELELAGVLVFSSEKDGRDAGDLVGSGPTGVIATTDKGRIFAMDADVVIHCPRGFADPGEPEMLDDDVIRLLESGKDVISTVAYFSPRVEGPELMKRIEAACRAGGSTLFGCGADPGFICDRVPALMSGLCVDIEQIRMLEVCDLSMHPVGGMMFDTLGFGKRPDELSLDNPATLYLAQRIFPSATDKLARRLNVDLERLETGELEFAFAKRDLQIAAGEVPQGTISGLTYKYHGYRAGDDQPFITHQWTHYVCDAADLPEGWPSVPEGDSVPGAEQDLHVKVDIWGCPTIRLAYTITDPSDPIWIATATPCIHAIPEVCAAAPGFFEEPVFGAWTPSGRAGSRLAGAPSGTGA